MRTLKWLALSLAVAGLGCGGDDKDMCGDAGCVTGADGGAVDAPMQWGFSPGMNNFTVTAISGVTDGCKINPGMLVGMTLPVNYASPTISIGEQNGTPPMASLGSGPASGNNATLTRENDTGDAACKYHQKDVSK